MLNSFQTKPSLTHLHPPTLLTAMEHHHTRVDVLQQEAREKYPSMLYQALRFPRKLEQPLLLGGREGIPDYHELAYKCSKGRDASREYVFPRGCDDIEHTSYPNPETTRSTILLSRVEPQILPGRRDMDLISLIRAPNPTTVKIGSHPHAAHEVSLLIVIANRVIEMEDPAAATDSSGVPSTIERSLLDFANENPSQQSTGSEDQEAAALEVPPPRIGHDGVDTNAPPKVLRRDHADPRPIESTHGGKSLAAIELEMGSSHPVPASQGAPVDFPNQTFIDTPTSAYATYCYGTSPHQEYLLEFTSKYGISEALYPKLPGLKDRIVDFLKGKALPKLAILRSTTTVDVLQQEAREKYPSMLYQALRFPRKLEQPLLLGGREGLRCCASRSQIEASQSRQSTDQSARKTLLITSKGFPKAFVNSLAGTGLTQNELDHCFFLVVTSLILGRISQVTYQELV
nr:hypothetical protein [Tanacetum cinerariifolium]